MIWDLIKALSLLEIRLWKEEEMFKDEKEINM